MNCSLDHGVRCTFPHVAAKVMRLDVSDLPLSRLVCVDVYSVEVFADVVERFELWIDCAANVSLDAQVEKPRLQPSGGGPF